MCFLFWPDTPESSARRKLTGLVNHLRRSHGKDEAAPTKETPRKVTLKRKTTTELRQPAAAAPHVRFRFAIGPRFFPEVAKLRAARLLWNRVLDACGVPEERRGAHIQARTSAATRSLYI